ncbi:hypothetical protein J6590_032475 [Homalodisca vitripennis]|nr:hypothetical protein J6590_032475 [Homalodisca vitripennis]
MQDIGGSGFETRGNCNNSMRNVDRIRIRHADRESDELLKDEQEEGLTQLKGSWRKHWKQLMKKLGHHTQVWCENRGECTLSRLSLFSWN